MLSLRELAAREVRRQWADYDPQTRDFVFDIVWETVAGTLPKDVTRLKDFCDSDDTELLLRDLKNGHRARYHRAAETLGINHESTGPYFDRVLVLQKVKDWRWEFTERVSQARPHRNRVRRRERGEDRKDAEFQVYCKYSAWGYDSPEDMLDGEPHFRELLGEYY